MGEMVRFVIELDIEQIGAGVSVVACCRSDTGAVSTIGWTRAPCRLPRTIFELAEILVNARRDGAAPEVRHG